MGKIEAYQKFLAAEGATPSFWIFVLNLGVAALLAILLGRLYMRCGRSLSNRSAFARNFVLLTLTTTLVIAVVKSSLALSLGLVGALSIVRFRAAIKEPEELAYLFLAIAIGLGLGANQTLLTVIGFTLIAFLVLMGHVLSPRADSQNLHLSVQARAAGRASLTQVASVLEHHCRAVQLRRSDETVEEMDADFLVEFAGFQDLERCKTDLIALGLRVSFLDDKSLPAWN